MAEQTYAKGLEGVVAAESDICQIDGAAGKLYYRGYSLEDLAAHSSFEEVTYLLLYEKLPTEGELSAFVTTMRDHRSIAKPVQDVIRSFPASGSLMELLQSTISYLSGYHDHVIKHDANCNCRQTLHQIAQLATVVAAYHRFKDGKEYVAPHRDLSHGANFLYMLRGAEPEAYEGEIMDRCLILHAEHGFNASTFTARVVASTLSTCYCSISAAIGSLYGSLHGGANERVLDTVNEIGSPENVDDWLDKALAAKRKVPGMGHRVYRAKDPRSVILEKDLQLVCDRKGDHNLYAILKKLEASFRSRMEEKGKPLYPNVDFFSGALYSLLGIPKELFTPIFAMSRSAGWLGHILEQRKDNRLYRPKCLFVGPSPREYALMSER
ncbi:MAG: citrate synthase [Chitinivibrionales bacterium]|nr:citrate synthase [Chitinivibrionales bacterium]